MRKLIVLTFVLSLLAGTATAGGFGLRGGLTANPDQFHVGAHADLGPVFPPMRLVPNVEVGFGDHVTLVAMNGDLLYDLVGNAFSVGGELGVKWMDYEFGGSNTDLGLSAVGDFRTTLSGGKTLLLEVKLGVLDAPDYKLTVGYSLF